MSRAAQALLADGAALLGAAETGSWCYEIDTDRFFADRLARELLEIDAAAEHVPWSAAVANIHPRYLKAMRTLVESADTVERARSLEIEVRPSGGEPRYVLLRARSLYEGGKRRVLGVLFDDSYRARLHAQLRQSEERFRMLAYGIPNAFFFLNEELHVEFANEEFARPLGKSVNQILGRHIREVLGAKLYAGHEHYFSGALRGKRFEYEARVRSLEGEERFLRISDRPAFDADGKIRGVFSQSTDITEMKRLEKQARTSEAKFRGLAQGVPNFLLFLNRDLRLEFCNDHFLRNTQWTQETARGLHISEILGPERYTARREFYERALNGETLAYESGGAVGNDGGYFRFDYQPSYDEEGRIRGVFSMATDISARRNAELALEAKQAELTRSNHDLEQFAYVASHDLKAPLRAMTLLVQWIRQDLGDIDAGNVQENLGLLERRTARLGRLLDDLLAYSRVGRKVGEHSMTDCNALVRDVIELCGAPQHIRVSIATQLPTFATYATPLEQVFRNLIGNAIKHHPGPTGSVTISHEEADEHYVFAVQDDGEGIRPEYAERVFQMFQTLKPRDEVEGSGMGLAIVQRIVAWQGGRVWFEPAPAGSGTVFRFLWKKSAQELPAARPNEVTQWQTARR